MAEREARAIPAWAPAMGVALALTALVAWSFAQRWSVLSASPFPIGIDGYFYPVQLRSLIEHGELQYPASPMAFWLMAPFAMATDPITGAKLGAAVLGALIALPAYGVGVELARDGEDSGRGPGLVAAALATSSAGSAYMTIEFVKNGIGLTVALAALWLVLRALTSPTRRRIGLALAGIAAAVLTHKMAAAIVIGMALPAALVEAHARGFVGNRTRWTLVGGAVGAIVVLVAMGMAAPRRFISPADLALLDGLFTSDADWSLPVLAGRLHLGYEPWIGLVLGALAAAALIVDRSTTRGPIPTATLRRTSGAGARVVAWCSIALAVLIGLPWLDTGDTQGLAMRLRVIAFVPLALCAAVVLRVGLRYLQPLFSGERRPPRTAIGAAVAAAIVALHVGGEPHTEGQILTHPALVTSAQALVGRLPEGAVAIVPERHIAFMIAWYTRMPISMRPESVLQEARRYRVMPLAFIAKGKFLDDALLRIRTRKDLPRVLGLHPNHPNGMIVVPELTWKEIVAHLPDDDRRLFTEWPTI